MKICVLTIGSTFSQKQNYNVSLNVPLFIKELRSLGLDVYSKEASDVANEGLEKGTTHVLVGGHPNNQILSFVKDICIAYSDSITILPSLHSIFAYENKGLQGLLANFEGLDFVKQSYFYKVSKKKKYRLSVFKSISGAGSSGVKLIEKKRDILIAYAGIVFRTISWTELRDFVKFFAAKVLLLNSWKAESRYRSKRPYARFVIQDLVPNLNFDYKVLVFGNTAYVLKRGVREGDFRASGSGKFDFVRPHNTLLEFAYNVRVKLNVPYVSLDIVEHASGYKVIEFQTIHFGAYTQMFSPKKYVRYEGQWRSEDSNDSVERSYAYGVVYHLGILL